MKLVTVTTEFKAGGNKPAKVLTKKEVKMAQILQAHVNAKNLLACFIYDGNVYACKMDIDRLYSRLAFGKNNNKFLSPLGRNQVIELIDDGTLKPIGTTENLDYYIKNDRYKSASGKYKVTNYGQAIEYYIAQKAHAKFDHYGKITEGNGEFNGCEVKLFNFDKTTGTPSATCPDTKTIMSL